MNSGIAIILLLLFKNIDIGKSAEIFNVAYYWNFLNFTWPSANAYQESLKSQRYIPSNNGLTGIKAYPDVIYISLPRFYPGTPVTLASFPVTSQPVNPLLKPYPNWEMNVGRSCNTLQNVYFMEIDPNGIMWVLDGVRFNNLTRCPPKIVLLDLNNNDGKVIQMYVVPNELSPHQGGWLNDLVLDETDGGYAYISEVSNEDPGIVVYSRSQNKGWKFRDRTMFAELDGVGYTVRGREINDLHSVDGIALSPLPTANHEDRTFYYTCLTGYNIHALRTSILKNESVSKTADWRKSVLYVGRRPAATDGMIIDNKGNLYFGLLDKYGIGKWNIYTKPFDKFERMVYQNYTTVDWPDTFGMDTYGNLYVTISEIERILNTTVKTPPKDGIRFRILRSHIGTLSYLYP